MTQALMPVLLMIGAGLLLLLAVPVGLLVWSGVHFARSTAVWLVPAVRGYAVEFGWRVLRSRLPQVLVVGAVVCLLTLPSLVVPAGDLGSHHGSVSRSASGADGAEISGLSWGGMRDESLSQ